MADEITPPVKKAKPVAKPKPLKKDGHASALAMLDDAGAAPPEESAAGPAPKAPGAAQTLRDGAEKMAKQATGKARDYVSEGKNRAGGALDELSRLMGEAASTVDEKLGAQYGQYARSAADGIAGFSESLKAKEIEDLVADAQGFVRKSPAVAIGIAAALGFVVARLVKAGLDTADAVADGEAPAGSPATVAPADKPDA